MSDLPFFLCPDTVTPISVSELPVFGDITVADGDGEVGADVTFAAVAQYFSTEVHDQIQALIRDLDLEFLGMEKIEEGKVSEIVERSTVS